MRAPGIGERVGSPRAERRAPAANQSRAGNAVLAMNLLREDLLQGKAVAIAGPVRAAVCDQLSGLGARLEQIEDGLDDEHAVRWSRSRADLAGLVVDTAAAFGNGGADRLEFMLRSAWTAVRAVATGALITTAGECAQIATAGEGARIATAGEGARIVLIAPSETAGPHAGAARAALENLARSLATEWARYGITVTAIAPGTATSDADVATLVAYLLSHAGGYLTGCRFDLGIV